MASDEDASTDPAAPAVRRKLGRPRLSEPSEDYRLRRAEIIDTAAKVFHSQGYDSGSLDDVAAALDLRKASLYYYVKSKAELLYLVFDRAITIALGRLEELSGIADPRQRLAALIVHQVSLVADEPSLFTVFFDSRPRLQPAYEQEIRLKERKYLRCYVEAVQQAVDAGALPALDPRYGAQAILGMSSWVYKWFDPKQDDWAALATDFVRLVLGDSDIDVASLFPDAHCGSYSVDQSVDRTTPPP